MDRQCVHLCILQAKTATLFVMVAVPVHPGPKHDTYLIDAGGLWLQVCGVALQTEIITYSLITFSAPWVFMHRAPATPKNTAWLHIIFQPGSRTTMQSSLRSHAAASTSAAILSIHSCGHLAPVSSVHFSQLQWHTSAKAFSSP